MRRRLAALLGLIVLTGLVATIWAPSHGPQPAQAAVTCDRTLNPGSSVTTFLATLTPGQTGCLRAGTYTGTINFPGTDQITLASTPGERATLSTPLIYTKPGADDITIRDLDVAGTTAGAPTIQIDGNRNTLIGLDITNSHQAESCIDVGYYPVTGFTLSSSTIHGCGKPSNGNHDHGIYIEGVTGGTISDNTFTDNCCGWDIQAWPRANVTVERNLMRATPNATEGGLIIAGGSGTTALTVRNNTMVGNGKASMFDSYQLKTGTATASGNCLVTNGSPLYESGWAQTANTIASSDTACGTATPTPTPTPTATATPSPTATAEPTATPTPSPCGTP